MPILAKEAIETAGLIENGEVFVAVFRAGFAGIARKTRARPPRTDEIRHTVRGKAVVVPAHLGLFPGSGRKSAKPLAVFRDPAIMDAKPARNPVWITRRLFRKAEDLAGAAPRFLNVWFTGLGIFPETAATDAHRFRDKPPLPADWANVQSFPRGLGGQLMGKPQRRRELVLLGEV
jgi:hypothetical protein